MCKTIIYKKKIKNVQTVQPFEYTIQLQPHVKTTEI